MKKERSMVRRVLFVFGAILLCVIVAALVAISLAPSRPPMPEVSMVDGRHVQLAGVTVGETHTMHSSSPLRNILFQFAPDGFKRQMGPNFNSSFGFRHPGIALWLMIYDPVLKQYVPNAINKLVIVDDHGCELENGSYGVNNDGYHSAQVMHVENFPRDRERLTFRMLSTFTGTNVLGEITIDNPVRRDRENWTAQSLPVMATNGNLTARLNRIAPVMRGNEDVEMFEDGKLSKDWELEDRYYSDPLGNFGSQLCRKETVWKLKLRFVRSARADFPATNVWKVGSVVIPPPGKFIAVVQSNSVAGIPLAVKSFLGSGSFTLVDGVCTSGTPWTNGMSSVFSVTGMRKGGRNITTTTRASFNPMLVVEHEPLHPERKFTARFRHEGKLVGTAEGANSDGTHFYYDLSWQVPPEEIPPANAALEMEIIVQRGVEFEFLVDPKDYKVPVTEL